MTDMLRNIEPSADLFDTIGTGSAVLPSIEQPSSVQLPPQSPAELSKQWLVAQAIFSVTREQMLDEVSRLVDPETGSPREQDAQPELGTPPELTAEERLIEEAYMMAKRAVRIALESVAASDVKDYAETLIGNKNGVQAKAQGYVSFILANMPHSSVSNKVE